MTGWGWAYMLFLSITWVVAVVVVTWAVVTVLRSGASSPDRGDARAARDILDERLAKGELDLEEYRNLRAAIDGPASSGERVPQG